MDKIILFLLLIFTYSSQAAKVVNCDYCSDSVMTLRAETASYGYDAVFVVDRKRAKFYKYIVTREVEPDQIYTTIHRITPLASEKEAIEGWLAIYQQIRNILKVDAGELGQGLYTDSALHYVGRPMAMANLRNAVNNWAGNSFSASLSQGLDMAFSTVIEDIQARVTVEFDDGSSWRFNYSKIVVDIESSELGVLYDLDTQSGLDEQGNPIPYRNSDLNFLSVSGNGPFLNRYADLISRLRAPVTGTLQTGCQVVGIRCDRQGCVFTYDCP